MKNLMIGFLFFACSNVCLAGNWGTVARDVKVKSVKAQLITPDPEVISNGQSNAVFLDLIFDVEEIGTGSYGFDGLGTKKASLNSCDPRGLITKFKTDIQVDANMVNALNSQKEIYVNITAFFHDDGKVTLHCIHSANPN
ncbi:MAG: hypothetical protein QE271_02415 [Bacteriovoracaceae bacterium]|nr:hypothetical protein [Bacteriovoracaceae bacterium]